MDVLVTLSKNDSPFHARVTHTYVNKQGVRMYSVIGSDEFTVSVTRDKIKEIDNG